MTRSSAQGATKQHVLITIHEEPEQPGLVREALEAAGLDCDIVNAIEQPEALPRPDQLDDVCGIVILGGPMAADEIAIHPGLQREADLALAAISARMPVLGICLGHQIIGRALGADLGVGTVDEFGVTPVSTCEPDALLPIHGDIPAMLWHHDEVALPAGAHLIATNAATHNQGFRYGSAVTVQFHIELDAPLLDRWLVESPVAAGMKASVKEGLRGQFAAAQQRIHAYVRPGLAAWAAACAEYAA